MRVIATAGHVDHGKSTLVRALTGIEPDRWEQERRRGLTIDLGYAWTTLPGGEQVAFVDVPGHERFIANMLAGVGPLNAAMLVVASDEGWRQQSQEHLDALLAVGIRHAVVVISRCDLASPDSAAAQVRERLARTSLSDSRVIAVSAVTGQDLDDLRSALAELCHALPAPDRDGRTRLWVDRVFTIRGAGTVVTGTLVSGRLAVGDSVQLADAEAATAQIRGLQSLESPVEQAEAVSRVAVNLRGVGVEDVTRGSVLLRGAWHLTHEVDARVIGVDVKDLPERLLGYVGTASLALRIRPLDADLIRLTWEQPMPLTIGDRLVLRDPGRQRVLGGALVLDADPPPLTRRGDARRRAAALADADGVLDLAREVDRRGYLAVDTAQALGATEFPEGLRRYQQWLISEQQWSAWTVTLADRVKKYAAQHPREARMSIPAAAAAVGLPSTNLVAELALAAGLDIEVGYLSPAGVTASLGSAEAGLARVESRLAAQPFAAPERDELTALNLHADDLATAVRLGRLIDLGDGVVLLPSAPALAMRALSGLPQPFTTSQARQALGSTRRVVIPLMELLDRKGWTRRVDAAHRQVVR